MAKLFCAGGPLAQLGERLVRNEEVVGSNPMRSTTFLNSLPPVNHARVFTALFFVRGLYCFGFSTPVMMKDVSGN
jgi:hypothetical protein